MRVVVGVGGGIAAFKAVELVRELGRGGAEVRVVLTPAGGRFVGAVTFAGLTGHPAVTDLWDATYAGEVHVALGEWADAVVVAPATMNLIARWAHGMADDALLATLACAAGRRLCAPAMHARMWERRSTRDNVARLRDDGVEIVGPVHGELASGEIGPGRMAEPIDIAAAVLRGRGADLSGRAILVTAGPTAEDLDPVRFLGNRSSGRMGFAVAERAAARGALVTLVHGPVELAAPAGVERVPVRSALEMQAELNARYGSVDALVMAAAVADYRPRTRAEHKLKKGGDLVLELVRNPDILADLGAARIDGRPVLVGFAVESERLVERARDKLRRKKVDLIVANHASVGFGGTHNEAALVSPDGVEPMPPMSKLDLADAILDRVLTLLPPAGTDEMEIVR